MIYCSVAAVVVVGLGAVWPVVMTFPKRELASLTVLSLLPWHDMFWPKSLPRGTKGFPHGVDQVGCRGEELLDLDPDLIGEGSLPDIRSLASPYQER
jgi:hypothetical protein